MTHKTLLSSAVFGVWSPCPCGGAVSMVLMAPMCCSTENLLFCLFREAKSKATEDTEKEVTIN